MAQGTPFSGFEVRTLKREAKHLETGALICALRLEGESAALIPEAWTLHFPEGPSRDDQLLVNSTIRQLCPTCLLYTSPSPRDATLSRMPSSA